MPRTLQLFLSLAASVAVAFGSADAANAAFPDKPVKILVGYAPGGGVDAFARLVAQGLTEKWGQPVVVENRAGADGTIAFGVLAQSPPDGYTLAMVLPSQAGAPTVRKLDYDAVKSFAPVTLLGTAPQMFVVPLSSPAKTLQEFIALAKANPGKYNYATGGTLDCTWLVMAIFRKQTGIDVVNVPYLGAGPMMTAMLSGDIDLMFIPATSALQHVKAGKVRALAIDSIGGFPGLPDVPTVEKAADLPGFDGGNWYGLMAPAGTPKDIINKIQGDIALVLKTPSMEKAMALRGITPIGSTPEEFGKFFESEIVKWAPLLLEDQKAKAKQ